MICDFYGEIVGVVSCYYFLNLVKNKGIDIEKLSKNK